MADAPKLQGTEKIGESYYKINMGIDNANEALKKSFNADFKSTNAVDTAAEAKQKSDNVQKQLDEIVVNGDSSVEAAQARVDADGLSHDNLKARADSDASKVKDLRQNVKQVTAPFKYDGAVFTFIDDDGQSAFLTKMKPIFDAKNVKPSVGIITANVGTTNYMTLNQIKSLQDESYDIVCHSKTHSASIYRDNLSSVPSAAIDSDLKEAQEYFLSNGLKGFDILIFPWGNFGSEAKRYKSIARKYFRYAMNAFGNHNDTPVDNVYMNRYALDMAQDFTTVLKPKIDECIANKGWMVFYTHSQENKVNADYMNTVIDYIRGQGSLILPFSEAIQYKGNAVSVGEFTETSARFFLSNDGKKAEKYGMNVEVYDSTIDLTRTPRDLDKGTIITPITSSKDTVTGLGGVLLSVIPPTSNGSVAWDFCYQTFTPYSKNEVYMRKWIAPQNIWGPFALMTTPQSTTNVTAELSGYSLASGLQTNVTKTGNLVSGTASLENAAGNGNVAQFDTLASFDIGYGPAKTRYEQLFALTPGGVIKIGLASIEKAGGKTVIKAQTSFNTNDIKRIIVNFSYNSASSQ